MKKVTFIASHIGSDSLDLIKIMNKNPRVFIHSSGNTYDSVSSLDWLYSEGHKLDNASAIYGDHLLFNPQLSTKSLYSICNFIYVIRPARPSLHEIGKKLSPKSALLYYTFRLRRLCEMAKRTPNAMLVLWQGLSNGDAFSKIENFLDLKDLLNPPHTSFVETKPEEVKYFDEAQDSYERHLYYLKHLDHLVM